MNRLAVLSAGLAGAAGVGLSAMAAHRGGAFLGTASAMLLANAPALLALGLKQAAGSNRFLSLAAAMLAAGLILFCGDLAAREFLEQRLFPFAAPAGGLLLIGGWLLVAASAVLPRRLG